jgi:large subunit ribosomal protein L5
MGTPRLKDKYLGEVVPALKQKFTYKSVMQVPKIEKICINKGMGIAVSDKKLIDVALEEITTISGQKAVSTKSKKAISNFKLRENMPIGVRVTLRGDKMYEFLGVKEQIIFPEISIDKVSKISGMDITFVTTAKTDEESFELLKALGMPFTTKN